VNIDDKLYLIKNSNFDSLYLNGDEFNFHVTNKSICKSEQEMSFILAIDGYIGEKYNCVFNHISDQITMKSYYGINEPAEKKIFSCVVRQFTVRLIKENYSKVSGVISLPFYSLTGWHCSSINETNFKFKEGSSPIGNNIYDIKDIQMQFFNRAMLFDWED
jgi:hypothetical protein